MTLPVMMVVRDVVFDGMQMAMLAGVRIAVARR